jgi:hypothetical protein
MLSALDESLFHQIPTTFDHVGTSDPRFFDRWWFAAYEPSGAGALQFTLAVYNNQDVADGGFVVVHDGRQHNLRASRTLRPRFEPVVGPLSVEVVEPLRHLRLVAAPSDRPISAELDWVATKDVEEEHPHHERQRGWVTQEYQRYNQIGTLAGWVQLGGSRVAVDDWWACRDHSWGVRPGVAGDAVAVRRVAGSGAAGAAGPTGFLFCFLFFSTARRAGHVQIAERPEGRVYQTGIIGERSVTDVDLSLSLVPGTRRFSTAALDVVLDDGEAVRLDLEALGPSIAMTGLGYSGGWDDGQGLGLPRGPLYVEHDVWDVTHPVDVVREDGTVAQPVHRIQPVRVRAGDDDVGTGSLTLLATGHLPQFGLG